MLELETEGLVEGFRKYFNTPKVYRLSKLGREQMGIERQPVSLKSGKINHFLAISDLFFDLKEIGNLHTFEVELRERFRIQNGQVWTFAPDTFVVINGKACFFEIQLTEIASKRWAMKWEVAKKFIEDGHYKTASFQKWEGRVIKPRIIVISNQQPDTVLYGTEELQKHVKMHVVRSVEEFKTLL